VRLFAPVEIVKDPPMTLASIGSYGDDRLQPASGQESERRWQPRLGHRYRGHRLLVKRWLDVVAAILLIIALAPLLAMTSVAVRLSSPGPAMFRQLRVGQAGQPFRIVKFRSMHVDAEHQLETDDELRSRYLNDGYKLPLHDDPRITKLGIVLRKTSIDELPQLWNVLKGEMSLVGPRPVLPDELGEYRGFVGAYLMAKPGLTGPWQVAGRDAVQFPRRARFDADYIDHWSLSRDAQILIRTIPATVKARGMR